MVMEERVVLMTSSNIDHIPIAWELLLVFVTTCILLTILYNRRRSYLSTGLPRGTMGWPIIGETLEFISCAYSPRPESFMDKRRRRYGDVFKSHIFGSPAIVSTDAEVSKAVLQNDGTRFVPFYPKSITELMGTSSILLMNGNAQKRIHGLIGGFLKSPLLKAQIAQDIEDYVTNTMKNWEHGKLVYIQDEAKQIAFQVLVKALISVGPGEDMECLKKEFKEFIAGLMSLPFNFPGTRLYKSLQAKKRMVKMVHKIIEERRKVVMDGSGEKRSSGSRDVLDALVEDRSGHLNMNVISDNMIDMMIPGEDSVPMLITLAVKYLTDCPLALQQLTEENMKMASKTKQGHKLSWSDYLSMPFTQNVITETLRMGNIIIGVMRKAVQDVEIKGYVIPKGWCVFAYFRSVHLDEQNYRDPYQFNPWRWQHKENNMTTNSNFTPFGGGQRLCPGVDLARLEASIFLHHLVTNYSWEAEEDTIVNFPTVSMRRRMPIRITRLDKE